MFSIFAKSNKFCYCLDTSSIALIFIFVNLFCFGCAFLQHLDLVSPLSLYFNPNVILRKFQLWRLATTFLFFGSVGINFFFNMVFTYRYCRMLEEGSFRGRSSDFVMMFLFGGGLMTFFGIFVNLLFLGQAFTLMLVYVWSRRNPFVRMNFFGVLNFQVSKYSIRTKLVLCQ